MLQQEKHSKKSAFTYLFNKTVGLIATWSEVKLCKA